MLYKLYTTYKHMLHLYKMRGDYGRLYLFGTDSGGNTKCYFIKTGTVSPLNMKYETSKYELSYPVNKNWLNM